MSASHDVLNLAEKTFARSRVGGGSARVAKAEIPVRTAPIDKHTKELQQLVNRVFLSPRVAAPKTVAFASISDGAGSGLTCARAAQLLARQNAGPVCVLDGNFSAKHLSSYYFPHQVPKPDGQGVFSREHCIPIEDNLWLAGDWVLRDEQGQLLPLIQIQKHLETLAVIFHYLLIDTAALLRSEDALTLAELAGAVVLIIEANVTLRRDADKVTQSLQSQGVRILGAVLNNWTPPDSNSLYSRI
jgi:Mrp family chromosome partitioning ATPase